VGTITLLEPGVYEINEKEEDMIDSDTSYEIVTYHFHDNDDKEYALEFKDTYREGEHDNPFHDYELRCSDKLVDSGEYTQFASYYTLTSKTGAIHYASIVEGTDRILYV
jgi:hypothetical protein